jgi:hypothetical protein
VAEQRRKSNQKKENLKGCRYQRLPLLIGFYLKKD